MNARKLSDVARFLLVALSVLALAITSAHAELLIGISFPSQGGGDNDTFEIDESLLTLPKLHLQDGADFGPDIRNWSSDATIKFSTTYTKFPTSYYPHQNIAITNVFPAFSYSPGSAGFDRSGSFTTGVTVREQLPSQLRSVNMGGKGTLQSSAASDSSTSVLATAPDVAGGILTVTLKQNTLRLDWPTDHIGWILQTQTNWPGDPFSSEWFRVLGSSTTNHIDLTLDRANTSVFFRLVAP